MWKFQMMIAETEGETQDELEVSMYVSQDGIDDVMSKLTILFLGAHPSVFALACLDDAYS